MPPVDLPSRIEEDRLGAAQLAVRVLIGDIDRTPALAVLSAVLEHLIDRAHFSLDPLAVDLLGDLRLLVFAIVADDNHAALGDASEFDVGEDPFAVLIILIFSLEDDVDQERRVALKGELPGGFEVAQVGGETLGSLLSRV